MAECNHIFTGRSDGVNCQKCGLRLSVKEYAEHLNKDRKPKRRTGKKVMKDE